MHLAARARKLFRDRIRITVRGGSGGHGLPNYGGIGGKGGDVYIQGSAMVKSLNSVDKARRESFFQGYDGESARRTCLVGKSGRDMVIQVPIGVSIEDSDGQQLGDINSTNDKIIVACGGRGGDKYNDSHGFLGQRRSIRLDLKMISDAVFVGFPNAGKSALLKAISNATPRVASFPFTTLRPYLGVIKFQDYRQITMADLPGLVEGAHKNVGLGHEFLKHIVRSKLLIFLIDVNPVDLGPQYKLRSPLEALFILNKEIELYDDLILNKPSILVISKIDTAKQPEAELVKLKEEFRRLMKSPELLNEDIRPKKLISPDYILAISSQTGYNLDLLKKLTRELIDREAEKARTEIGEISNYRDQLPNEFNRIVN